MPDAIALVRDEVQRVAARVAADRLVRLVDEALHVLGQPVISARRARLAAHPLLHDAPVARRAEKEYVVIELIAVLHGCRIDLGGRTARVDGRARIPAGALARFRDLRRRLPRRVPLSTRREKAEIAIDRLDAFLDGAAH